MKKFRTSLSVAFEVEVDAFDVDEVFRMRRKIEQAVADAICNGLDNDIDLGDFGEITAMSSPDMSQTEPEEIVR